ncbi:Oxoglutarate/iron-dependent dioxygenase [Penicillium argentinense]|uniref:Oxoglutarate/iron-dependent dioxygenase n=1 Tax=Penicillium argentinense TaxID=1131581 RepID=A0A9W9KEQ8_9EURO|nr:Oxoglutarate/iron-dependent dioxygenase [Penicillium argentinense]KAJ5103126.1 Oxoglutarate/iron-dependent dioxygenase [Penicillium argentinense]
MATDEVTLPLVDLSGYINPQQPGDKERVIAEVRDACAKYGFFQATGHGIPLGQQKGMLKSINTLFNMPVEEKRKLSFLKNPCRRGYEESGASLRDGDPLPDSKEAYYIGREDPVVEHSGFYGPNVWPPLPEEEFRNPVWEYYQSTHHLGQLIWEILLLGLGHPVSLMEEFAKRPMVVLKMIRYPPHRSDLPGQFGVGPHTDFGGITVLLQEAGKHGLQVWHEGLEQWLPVKAAEDIYIINCGDMIGKWSGGQYKSAKHRVINAADNEPRLSCATFFHGDLFATNPLNPSDPNRETVGALLVKRFRNQFSFDKELIAAVGAPA